MPVTSALRIVANDAEPISPALASLRSFHEQRAALAEKDRRLFDALPRLEAGKQDEIAIRAETAALDDRERATMDEWVRTGAVGDPPALDAAKRAALAKRLSSAEAKAATAKAAAAAIERDHAAICAEMNRLADPIAEAAIGVLLDEAEIEARAAVEAIDAMCAAIAKAGPSHAVIVEEIHRLRESGHQGGTTELLRRLERFPLNRETVARITAEVPIVAKPWTDRLAALKSHAA